MAFQVTAQANSAVRPSSQDGRAARLCVTALAFPAPAKGPRYVSRAPALSLTSQGAPTSLRGPPSVFDRVSSQIVPLLNQDFRFALLVYFTTASSVAPRENGSVIGAVLASEEATVGDIVSFAAELNGHVEPGQRQRFKGTCNPLRFSFPDGNCIWAPTNELGGDLSTFPYSPKNFTPESVLSRVSEGTEVPAAIQAHLQDRAVECGVKSVTLVMESDSDVHSVRCLCIGTFVKITHSEQGSRVLSSQI